MKIAPALLFMLGIAALADGKASAPKETVMVPMRDGIRLATDIRGADPAKAKPVLLLRTPYNKNNAEPTASRYADAGYVSIVQDTRGAFASEGRYVHHNNDEQDGFDTLEWISRQPWSNGRVGMWGSSHPGAVQWLAAAERPYGLAVLTPTAASPSLYRTAYSGGALRLALIGGAGPLINTPPDGKKAPADLTSAFFTMPLADLDLAIGWPMPWLRAMVTHPWLDGFWNRQDVTKRVEGLDLPAQHIAGVFDFLGRETVASFQRLRKRSATARARANQQLILGPWDHSTIGRTMVAGVDFSTAAQLDVVGENLKWFDRFLKPGPAVPDFPRVRYFVMGRNEWRTADDWPPPGVSETALYLHSGGHANTRRGDGLLAAKAATREEPPDRLESNPRDPVPAEPPGGDPPPRSSQFRPVNRATLEDRADVLVYSTPPQAREVIVAGTPRAELWVSVDAPDADFALKLVDVAPDGVARPMAEGFLRLTHRESDERPSPVELGKVYRIDIELGHTAFALKPGHALRMEIAGSCFPTYDRNPHTGQGPFSTTERPSTQFLHHAPGRPSRVVLPLLEGRLSGH